MRAKLRALRRVQRTLEERAEDGRLDIGPIEASCHREVFDFIFRHLNHVGAVEEAAVEIRDLHEQEFTAVLHSHKKFSQVFGELFGIAPRFLHEPLEYVFAEQPDILGEQAKEQLHQEMRGLLRINAALPHGIGDAREGGSRFGRDMLGGAGWPELVGIVEAGSQDFDGGHRRCGGVGRREADGIAGCDGFKVELVDALFGVGEIGVYLETFHVCHDQKRRVAERFSIFEQLGIGGVQILVFAFVFNAKFPFPPDVGPAVATVGDFSSALFEAVFLISAGVDFGRRGLIEHQANISPMLLIALAFA
ncbi:MAG: hypothetical protein HUU29_07615 [Planctomycetaceae bacterium]|nr:hypothetical protein [Planctomycetaceae bacterium]